MKDMYSFHTSLQDLEQYYDRVKQQYLTVFSRCGLNAIITEASGGVFSKYSHEYQIATPSGEDLIYQCDQCHWAVNREIADVKAKSACPSCEKGSIHEIKAIEVGNIFKLSTRFADDFGFHVTLEDGSAGQVWMGCYGIGPSRVMGSIVEVHHDDRGMIWPKSVAPSRVHMVSLASKDEEVNGRVEETATSLIEELEGGDVDVLWDDREGVSAGEKFADADLIGIPLRLVVSQKSLAQGSVEWKERHEQDARLVKLEDVGEQVKEWLQAPDRLTSHD
jgi:prolyl-tRNA synthetase